MSDEYRGDLMAIVNDGGGGSTMQICAVSPLDQQGAIDNLVSRVEELERIVSELLGANLNANQLSDISQQVGWVYGITYMGVEGWIQTASGSLIPPAGWTLSGSGILVDSDGVEYQGVLMDSDGVLQYGYTASGGVAGVLAEGYAKDTMVLSAASQTLDSFNEALIFSAIQFQSGSSISWNGSTTLTLDLPGTYIVTFRIESASWNTPPTATDNLYMRFSTALDDAGTSNPNFYFPPDATGLLPDFKTIVIHKKTSHAATLTVNFRNVDGSVNLTSSLSIVRLDNK